MKAVDLKFMTVDQLVERFAEIGVAQYQALEEHEIWIEDNPNRKYNRLFKQMNDVDNELHARGREARLALLRLYGHPNIQVRLKAAVRTDDIAPDAARPVLQAIADAEWYPQTADARLALDIMDGKFKLDGAP